MEHDRGNTEKQLGRWHRDIAHKDADGYLLLEGLSYIDGICVGPLRWREISGPQNQEPSAETMNALRVPIDSCD